MRNPLMWILPVIAVSAMLWLVSGDDEEQRILDRLEKVRVLAEVRGPENAFAQLARATQLSSMFSTHTRYDLTTLGHGITEIDSREDLAQKIAGGRRKLASLELTLLAPALEIDGEHATVAITGTAMGATVGGDGQFMDVHRIEIELVRQDDEWLVSGARHIRDERAAFGGE